jgi:phospholipase C
MGMAYFTSADMPYYYALADTFTIGDQYHQSTLTQTNPNRLHLFSGSNGLSVGQTPFLDNSEPNPGHTWTTVAEVLEGLNISWRIYQQEDNFDDNGCAWFANFQKAKPGSPLFDKGMATVDDLVEAFAKDVAADALPQVSWIVGPANLSEHASYHPSAGEDLTARLVKALASNPAVYKKTAFLFMYDEGGQFFDSAVPYTIPVSKDGSDGDSTVATTGEEWLGLPIGPGFRVPFMAISPWSRGGYVVSQLFDHTSTVRFIEARFNLTVPTISPWRRAMLGDLTSAFNFSAPDYSTDWVSALPDTTAYPAESIKECDTLPAPRVPAVQSMPSQPPGTRPSRALPYALLVTSACSPTAGLSLVLNNTGSAGLPALVFDYATTPLPAPRKFAVEAGVALAPRLPWSAASGAPYDLALHSVNGFARLYKGAGCGGTEGGAGADVAYDSAGGRVVVVLAGGAVYNISDVAYGSGGPWAVSAPPGPPTLWTWDASPYGNHYDLLITLGGGTATATATTSTWARRAMGRMENGGELTSDPALGTSAPALHPFTHPERHPDVPEELRQVQRRKELTPAQLKAQGGELHKEMISLTQRFGDL